MADEVANDYRAAAFSSGFAVGVAVGVMSECCKRDLVDYADLVPPSYIPAMRTTAAKCGYNLIEGEIDEQGQILVTIEKQMQDGDCTVRPGPVSISGKAEM